ncbi:MAG: MBL fold metallo-hydrolase [Chloroflexi bacterium]|nr:MBL fold metallo-hydrolase [Chloroflexota bacterium]
MNVVPFVHEGLGNSSYLVGLSDVDALLVDPDRSVGRYLSAAEGRGWRVVAIFETHLHADFVSGARELAARTGAVIGASAQAGLAFEHRRLVEGDRIPLGDPSTGAGRGLALGVLATPGHTPEHISFTVAEAGGKGPAALFSGGALIVGGAARTDLLGPDLAEPLARQLFHTIREKLLALPDAVDVYPTHGAGSFCVAPASTERTTTIGRERQGNPLAQARTEDEFLARARSGLPSYPTYYREMRPLNQRGPRVLGGIPTLAPLAPAAVRDWMAKGGSVLDVRPAPAFADSHITGAYGIALSMPLNTWAGWLVPFGTPLVLVVEGPAEREEAVRQLIRIGYDDLRGYLEGGLAAWAQAGLPLEGIKSIGVAELREHLAAGLGPVVLDVRDDAEWEAGHIPGAVHIESGALPAGELPLPQDRTIAVHCQHGPRATAGISVLARRGYRDLALVEGSFPAWEAAGYAVERGPGQPQ